MYTINSDILSKCGFSVSQLDSVLAGTGLEGLGSSFASLEQRQGINAIFAIAHAFIESGRGWSWLAVNRNNIFGIAAFDSNPYDARSYPSKADCIIDYGNLLASGYLHPGGFAWGGGTSVHDIFVHYSTSHDVEAQNIVNIMNQLVDQINQTKNPILKVIQGIKPSSNTQNVTTYQVQPGDTLSEIAVKLNIPDWHTIYTQNLNILNQEARNHGKPENDPQWIFPGTILTIPLANASTVTERQTISQQPKNSNEVWITVPAGYGGFLSTLSQKYGTSIQQIIDWNKAKYPMLTPNYIQAGWVVRVR